MKGGYLTRLYTAEPRLVFAYRFHESMKRKGSRKLRSCWGWRLPEGLKKRRGSDRVRHLPLLAWLLNSLRESLGRLQRMFGSFPRNHLQELECCDAPTSLGSGSHPGTPKIWSAHSLGVPALHETLAFLHFLQISTETNHQSLVWPHFAHAVRPCALRNVCFIWMLIILAGKT